MESQTKSDTMPLHDRVAKGVERGRNHFEILDKRIKDHLARLKDIDARIKTPDAETMKMLADFIAFNDSILEACAQFDFAVGYDMESIRKGYVRYGE